MKKSIYAMVHLQVTRFTCLKTSTLVRLTFVPMGRFKICFLESHQAWSFVGIPIFHER